MPSTIPLEQIWGEGRGAGKEGGREGRRREGGREEREEGEWERKRKSKYIKVVMPVNSKEGGRERRRGETDEEGRTSENRQGEADVQVIWTVFRLCQPLS